MSAICGIRSRDTASISDRLSKLLAYAEPYGPDSTSYSVDGEVGIGLNLFSTKPSNEIRDEQCATLRHLTVAFDGRLDNRDELRNLLSLEDPTLSAGEIVLHAFVAWGEDCFARFVGEWALCLNDSDAKKVYLARDHAGTRTLFFSVGKLDQVWSNCLESFLPEGLIGDVDNDYVAAMLCGTEVGDRTPYASIRSVPPRHYVVLDDTGFHTHEHWASLRTKHIEYSSDSDYEEHFFCLFQQAVSRRISPRHLMLAELSGGVDSSSIVCMADHITKQLDPSAPLIDTMSYFDDTEETWDERPYFSIIEAKRGKQGFHIDVSGAQDLFLLPEDTSANYLIYPGMTAITVEQRMSLSRALASSPYRCVLSGLGGDELLGGVPSPYPELAGYLFSGHFTRFVSQTIAWSSSQRRTIWKTAATAAKFGFYQFKAPQVEDAQLPRWVPPQSRARAHALQRAGITDLKYFSNPMHAVANARMWPFMLGTLKHNIPCVDRCTEYRYPYLDRDLVEFLFAVPRNQLLRPGHRRSLMRRALKTIVPTEVLDRKRKAYVMRNPLTSLRQAGSQIERLFSASHLAQRGLINDSLFLKGIEQALERNEGPALLIIRAIHMEILLRMSELQIDRYSVALTQTSPQPAFT